MGGIGHKLPLAHPAGFCRAHRAIRDKTAQEEERRQENNDGPHKYPAERIQPRERVSDINKRQARSSQLLNPLFRKRGIRIMTNTWPLFLWQRGSI